MAPNQHSVQASFLSDANRPIRLRLWYAQEIVDDLLLVKQVSGAEQVCGGLHYRLLCFSPRAGLALKQFIAVPVELQFVTDTGKLRTVCGIVDSATAGEADGGLATYELIVRDALSLMDKGCNTRIFRDKNEVQIADIILSEWMHNNPVLGRCFNYETWCQRSDYPQKAFTMQYNESDAAFLRRLLKRRGLAWFFQPDKRNKSGKGATLGHSLILFDDVTSLEENAAGTVRYHRDDGTEARDGITAWHAVRTLTPGAVMRQSWDYKSERMHAVRIPGMHDQGGQGRQFAASLTDNLIEVPHVGDDGADFETLGTLRVQRHELASKCYRAEAGIRALCPGQRITVTGHADIDSHPPQEREFVITELRVEAANNLPKALGERLNRLFALSRWSDGDGDAHAALANASSERGGKYTCHFTCVRRGIAIVPAYDPRVDLPRVGQLTAVVIGPEGETVHCDALGRVKVRFPGCRPDERENAGYARNDDITEYDSAWLQMASYFAGAQIGALHLPRVGTLVTIAFSANDPDKPIILGAVHGGVTLPPSFSHTSRLPGDRYLSGIVTREIGRTRSNQLRFDDTPAQISAQLASDHGATQLNLGYLTHPRRDGQAQARGAGFELRTDDSGSIRTAKSLLISTWKRLDACHSQFSSEEHVALMQDCLDLFKTLGQYAAEHQALALDAAPQAELKEDVSAAAAGNGAPQGPDAKPTLSLTAPTGIALSTPKTIVNYAGANFDAVARQHVQLTSGQHFNVNAGKSVSVFAHKDGIKQIAHYGKFLMQSQHGDTEINAGQNVTITATDGKIVLMAKEIHAIAEDGSFIKIGGGVTLGSNGDITNLGANFSFGGPATMHTALPYFAGDGKEPPNWIALHYLDPATAQGMEGTGYEIHFDGGPVVTGDLDAQGKARHENVMNKPVKKVVYNPRKEKEEMDAPPLQSLIDM